MHRDLVLHRPLLRTVTIAIIALLALGQVGCQPAKPFLARDVWFNATQCRSENNTVAVVALTQSEWENLEVNFAKFNKPKERLVELDKKLQGDWAGRSTVVKLEGRTEHRILSRTDPKWADFRARKDAKGESTAWFALLVLQTNWSSDESDRWRAGYKAGPDDTLGEDVVNVNFAWIQDAKSGGPALLSQPSPKN